MLPDFLEYPNLPDVTLAKFIDDAIKRDGRGIAEIARCVGVAKRGKDPGWQTVQKWTLGTVPGPKNLNALADALGMTDTDRVTMLKLASEAPKKGAKTKIEPEEPPASQRSTRADQQGEKPEDVLGELLSAALQTTKSLEPRRIFSDVGAVMAKMHDAAYLVAPSECAPEIAALWLESVAVLRISGEKITAASIAAVSADLLLRRTRQAAESKRHGEKMVDEMKTGPIPKTHKLGRK